MPSPPAAVASACSRIEEVASYGVTGPIARASGFDMDLRRDDPYLAYPDLDVRVVLGDTGDCYDRFRCLLDQVQVSLDLAEQCLDRLPTGAVNVKLPKTVRAPEGHTYVWTENPLGAMGYFLVSRARRRRGAWPCGPRRSTTSQLSPQCCRGHASTTLSPFSRRCSSSSGTSTDERPRAAGLAAPGRRPLRSRAGRPRSRPRTRSLAPHERALCNPSAVARTQAAERRAVRRAGGRRSPSTRPSRRAADRDRHRTARRLRPLGVLHTPWGSLDVWSCRQYAGGLWVPVKDTSTKTYGGGRYLLDTAKGADLGERDGGSSST